MIDSPPEELDYKFKSR